MLKFLVILCSLIWGSVLCSQESKPMDAAIEEDAKILNDFSQSRNFSIEELKKATMPLMTEPGLNFVSFDDVKKLLADWQITSTQYRMLDTLHFIVIDRVFDKKQNKYFDLYRMAYVKNALEVNGEGRKEYVKSPLVDNFKPFYKEIPKQDFSHIYLDSTELTFLKKIDCINGICAQIQVESIKVDPVSNFSSFSFKPKGILKSFNIINRELFATFEMADKTADQVWIFGKDLQEEKVDLSFVENKKLKIDYAQDSTFIINDVLYWDVNEFLSEEDRAKNKSLTREDYSFFKCQRDSGVYSFTFDCLGMSRATEGRRNFEKIVKEHGNFLRDFYFLKIPFDGGEGAILIKEKKGIIDFVDSYQRDDIKKGEQLTIFENTTLKKFTGTYEKINNLDFNMRSFHDYYITGVVNLDNPQEFYKIKKSDITAFRNFKSENFKFCNIADTKIAKHPLEKVIKSSENYKSIIYPDNKITTVKLDEDEYVYFSYYYHPNNVVDPDNGSDTDLAATLVFKKIGNEYKRLFKLDQSLSISMCLKTPDSPKWQLQYEAREKYQGDEGWAELTDTGLQKYYKTTEWMD